MELDLSTAQRAQLWTQLQQMAEAHLGALEELPVAPATSESLRERVEAFDFAEPVDPAAALDEARRLLTDGIVHTGHPRYFGLFNPAPTFMGIAADALVAAFNPQLAAASHAPAAVEVERHLVRYLGTRFGLPPDEVAGSFTSGGAEANFTAVLVALTKTFPQLADDGLRSLPRQPVLYASQQSHLAVSKIAHAVGLGRHALRLVPTDDALALDVPALEEQIARDRAAGEEPFMVLATAGTTAAGIIDPLPAIAQLCQQEKLYFHVDAAWGGAAIFSPRLSPALAGIEAADSITFDSHKWLSVPMGAGMFIGRDADALAAAFAVTTGFMPAATDLPDPYVTSAQWSRRFIGLKVLLSLVVAGSDGYARQIEADCGRADLLRARLAEEGWDVINRTPLPVICFVDGDAPHDAAFHQQVATAVIDSGEAWISAADLGHITALRACMISHRTRDEHVEQLAAAVGRARQRLTGGSRASDGAA